jgi:23S rRNA U2552 (ribose-2'-O)-methylase RlmE/FtsJ
MTDVLDYNILSIYKIKNISNSKKNILEYDTKPLFSSYSNMPLFKYGFYYFIHQTKDKTEIFEKEEFKSQGLYKIVNQFEDTVSREDYVKQFKTDKLKLNDDIKTFSIKYFQSNVIASRAFYKLWELIIMFPLIPDKKNITSIHLAEAPGSFVQAVIFYRKKFFKNEMTNDDKYIAVSYEDEKETTSENYRIPHFFRGLNKYKNFNIWQYKNSDLTKIDIIDKLVNEYKSKADFVTADGGLNWKDENYQEQEVYLLLLSEIYCGLKIQKANGNFVLKIYETFTELTVKIIEILKQFYKDIYITKPLLSRPSNSEKYIVCIDYHNNDKYLDKIYSIIKEANKHLDKYLIDIFPDYQIEDNLNSIIKLSSTQLSNQQHKHINEMITYINNGNYYGDAYKSYLAKRREANDFWINIFYPPAISNLINSKKIINKMMNDKLFKINELLIKFDNNYL